MTQADCAWCGEPVRVGEQSKAVANAPMHVECAIRSVAGSVAHILQKCSCFVPGATEGDDPRLSKRQAARVAAKLFLMPQQGKL